MDLQSRFLSNIVLHSIRRYFHHQTHPQLSVIFSLGQMLHSVWISNGPLLFPSSILHSFQPGAGVSSSSVMYFCLFILFMGFSRQECWSDFPFLSPVDHLLSEVSIMTCLSWVALHGMTYSYIELDKAVTHVITLVSFLRLWISLSPLWWMRIRGLWKLPDRRDWFWVMDEYCARGPS